MGGGHIPAESLDADELDVLVKLTVGGEIEWADPVGAVTGKAIFLDDGGDIFGEIGTRGSALGRCDCGDSQQRGRSRGGNDGFSEHKASLPLA